ncbi:sucA [Gossypium australe]|uniref:SucA n=1 Tax=Gossypium australe TaxID=47621 RepID=A0A5B6XCK0_9ROSI|nr:sucA [Gossypium australe]
MDIMKQLAFMVVKLAFSLIITLPIFRGSGLFDDLFCRLLFIIFFLSTPPLPPPFVLLLLPLLPASGHCTISSFYSLLPSLPQHQEEIETRHVQS